MALTQNEIIIKQNLHNHFSSIASKYRSVRTLDTVPVSHITNQIKGKSKINIADIGCGDGRYSLEFLKTFQQNIKDNFDDLDKIKWIDENILIEIKK